MEVVYVLFVLFLFSVGLQANDSNKVGIDEKWVCDIKTTCLDCLQLSHCSWCETESKCFSGELSKYELYCQDKKINYTDYGQSIEENAKCSCGSSTIVKNCSPPNSSGEATSIECSGRGQCICGRCRCDAQPDPSNPSKAIMGEYCEYDNYSCDGPKCNEGPYNIHYVNTKANTDDEPQEKGN